MDRIDSNSVLAVVSKSLQQCLQDAIDIAAEYAGREPCEVVILVTSVLIRGRHGLLRWSTCSILAWLIRAALEILRHGGLGDDVEIDEILSNSENEELADLEMQVKRTEAMAEIGDRTATADQDK